jgi:hypothetical protein
MARKFFYVCAGLFLLALSYHLGAQSAGAQSGSSVSGVFADGCNGMIVMTPNGDIFVRPGQLCSQTFSGPPVYAGNFWAGSGPTPIQRESFGSLKTRHR